LKNFVLSGVFVVFDLGCVPIVPPSWSAPWTLPLPNPHLFFPLTREGETLKAVLSCSALAPALCYMLPPPFFLSCVSQHINTLSFFLKLGALPEMTPFCSHPLFGMWRATLSPPRHLPKSPVFHLMRRFPGVLVVPSACRGLLLSCPPGVLPPLLRLQASVVRVTFPGSLHSRFATL